ncbi:membrane protein [Geomonas limicola]|uniref:Membrane protein n=1 Tax=Geomonas limicola TaxID=2740186 RepID=A0A6V8N6N2_9BACT|nr:DUF898 family protein [Geomonas limicola]GFO68010.1 membrane protein [Geomonas limicola]
MPHFTLVCPVCNFSKELDVTTLPPEGTKVTCPACRSVFPLQREEPPADPATIAAIPPATDDAAAAPAAPRTPVPEKRRTLTFSFTGNAREYFGIWIVNTLLRIVTLGLYSPWAKVRKRRYFYGNSLLDGAPFDFLADPWAILKGWLIAGLFFGAYSLASRANVIAALAFMLLFFAIFPWVVVRSRIFNLRNTTHRNIHFGFNPDYREAYRVFLWWQLLVPFTGGVLMPYVIFRQKRFLVENSRYGTTPFRFHATAGEFFRIFLPLLILIPLSIGAGVAVAVFFKGDKLAGALPVLIFALIYPITALYVQTAFTNLTWNSTSLGKHRFSCSLRVRDLAWIYLSNAGAVLCSLGLLAPWAAVRTLRYRLRHLTASGVGGFDAIIAASEPQVGAAAEELGDLLGFDLGI